MVNPILQALGVRTSGDLILRNSSMRLEADIRAVPGLVQALGDDTVAFYFGNQLVNRTVRKIDAPLFLDLNTGEIGQMLANLREKNENYMAFMFLRPDQRQRKELQPEMLLKAAGWTTLNDAEEVAFYTAWQAAGRHRIEEP